MIYRLMTVDDPRKKPEDLRWASSASYAAGDADTCVFVRATDPITARYTASELCCGDEGPEAWLDPTTELLMIPDEGPAMILR